MLQLQQHNQVEAGSWDCCSTVIGKTDSGDRCSTGTGNSCSKGTFSLLMDEESKASRPQMETLGQVSAGPPTELQEQVSAWLLPRSLELVLAGSPLRNRLVDRGDSQLRCRQEVNWDPSQD